MFFQSHKTAWVGVAVVVLVGATYTWYHWYQRRRQHAQIQERLATLYIPALPSEAPEKKSDFLLLVYGPNPAPGVEAWSKQQKVDYFAHDDASPWDAALAFLERYEYVLTVSSKVSIFHRSCTLDKFLRECGDAEIVFARSEADPKEINLDVIIFRNGQWARLKIDELRAKHPEFPPTQQLLEPAYVGPLLKHTFSGFQKDLDQGLPYLATLICVVHEHALVSSQSHFFRYVQNLKTPSVVIFPWAPLKHEEYVQQNCVDANVLAALEAADRQPVAPLPKYVFQTMETSILTRALQKCSSEVQRLNPESTYYYFTTYDCRNFIRKYYPECLEAYDTLLPGAYKADLWRYCVLHRYGGIYLDIGVMPYVGFRSFLHPSTEFLSSVDLRHTDLYQALLGARSQHPVLQYAIDECVSNVKQRTLGEGSLEITGPAVMGRALNKFLGRLPEDNLHSYADKMNVQLLRWDSLKTVKDLVWNDIRVACHKYTKLLSKNEADEERRRWLALSGKVHYGILYAQQRVYPRQLFQIKR